MSPGPNGVLVAKTVSTAGRHAGFANVAGFFVSFYVHGTLSILGISLILLQSAYAFFIIKILGAGYLLYLGIKSLRDAYIGVNSLKKINHKKKQTTLHRAFIEGFMTSVLNPKVSMFYLAAFPQFMSPTDGSYLHAYTLVLIHSLINLAWFTAMVLIFSRLTEIGIGKNLGRWINAMTGVVFIGFGTRLALLKS